MLNEAIGILTTRGDQDAWVPAMLSVSDSFMTAHPIQVPEGEVGGCGEVGRDAGHHCLLLEGAQWVQPVPSPLVTRPGVGRQRLIQRRSHYGSVLCAL